MSTQTRSKNQQTTGSSRPRAGDRVIAVAAAVAAVVAVVVAVAAVTLAASVNLGNISIVSGWFPVFLFFVTVGVCLIAVVLRRDVLKEFAIGIPVGIAFVVLLAIVLHITQEIPVGAPRSMYVWLGVACLVAGSVAAGWRRAHWARRIAGVVAVLLAVLSAGSAANQTFAYYPTFDRLFGKDANHFMDNAQLDSMRKETARSGKLPDHGATLEVSIPGKNLRFTPRRRTCGYPRRGSGVPSPSCRSSC